MASFKEKMAAKVGTTKAPTPASAKKDRPIIVIDDALQSKVIDRMASADLMVKTMKGHQEASKASFLPWGLSKVLFGWIKKGNPTENVQFQTPNGTSFILQIKDTLKKFKTGWMEDGQPKTAEQFFTENNIPEVLIERLTEQNEFQTKDSMTIPIATLEKDNEKLCEKLFELIILANEEGVKSKNGKTTIKFSDDDLRQIIVNQKTISLKEGFLDRMVGHCKEVSATDDEALENLNNLFQVVNPTVAYSSIKVGTKHKEILEELINPDCETITLPAKEEIFATKDGKYTLKVKGTTIAVIRSSDNREMATKTCTDAGHVNNTIKKWQREPDSLAGFIAENIK